MARIRSINPQAPIDEDVATMSLAARYAWAYLPCHADREGRLRDSSFAMKAAIFPGDAVDMEAVLCELAARRHILRYAVDGRRFIQIRNFSRYQFPHHRENPSVIPAPGEPEASPRLALGKPDPSPPDPDPGPEKDPEKGIPPGQASGQPQATDLIWNAERWLTKFKAAWEQQGVVGGTVFYGQTSDAPAVTTLSVELARLPNDVKLSAQERAPAMFEKFFRAKGSEIERRRYPFSFFVQDFGTLRMESGGKRAEKPLRPPENPIPYHMRVKLSDLGPKLVAPKGRGEPPPALAKVGNGDP